MHVRIHTYVAGRLQINAFFNTVADCVVLSTINLPHPLSSSRANFRVVVKASFAQEMANNSSGLLKYDILYMLYCKVHAFSSC